MLGLNILHTATPYVRRASTRVPVPADRWTPPMNSFDAALYVCLFVAVAMGFKSGLLRSLATIFGYLAAMPVVVVLTPALSPFLIARWQLTSAQILLMLFGVVIVVGMVLAALLRTVLSHTIGPHVSIPDRLAGSMLGGARVALLAVLVVGIFDRIIPADRQPSFLAESRLRPPLSKAGRMGLKSLPPEVEDYIDRLKRQHGI
jgi:membrane protein required for colicin V production